MTTSETANKLYCALSVSGSHHSAWQRTGPMGGTMGSKGWGAREDKGRGRWYQAEEEVQDGQCQRKGKVGDLDGQGPPVDLGAAATAAAAVGGGGQVRVKWQWV